MPAVNASVSETASPHIHHSRPSSWRGNSENVSSPPDEVNVEVNGIAFDEDCHCHQFRDQVTEVSDTLLRPPALKIILSCETAA